MNPIYIPTMTGRVDLVPQHDCALYSITQKKPLTKLAKELTVIDCWTWGARRAYSAGRLTFDEIEKHYLWYMDIARFLPEQAVLVAPDFDWLPEINQCSLKEHWVKRELSDRRFLYVPGSFAHQYRKGDEAGYALPPVGVYEAHPVWTHSFSGMYKPLNGDTELWTYDSQKEHHVEDIRSEDTAHQVSP